MFKYFILFVQPPRKQSNSKSSLKICYRRAVIQLWRQVLSRNVLLVGMCTQFSISDIPKTAKGIYGGDGVESCEDFLVSTGFYFPGGLSLNVAQTIFWQDSCYLVE